MATTKEIKEKLAAAKPLLPEGPTQALTTPGSAMLGISNVEADDITWPRVLLMQAMSKFVTAEDSTLKSGQFVNSLTRRPIENTRFVPIAITKHHFGLTYINGKKKVEFKTTDKNDPRLKGRTYFNKGENKATASAVLACLALVEGKPAIVSFASTSYSAGKDLLGLITYEGKPMTSLAFKLTRTQESNDRGTFYVMHVEAAGAAGAEEQAQANQFQAMFLSSLDEKIMRSMDGEAEV